MEQLECTVVRVDEKGSEIERNEENKRLSLDFKRCSMTTFHDNFINSMRLSVDRILSVSISGADLQELVVDTLFRDVIPQLTYLTSLNASYVPLSYNAQQSLARVLNPSVSGFCSIQQLLLTRCNLGIKGCTLLFESLLGNFVLQELVLTGNKCTDAVIPTLCNYMRDADNKLKVLGIGENNITAEGMHDLASMIMSHRHLRNVQFNGNPLGDDGAAILFNAVWRNESIETLGLSRCDLTSCSWAHVFQYMTTLNMLSLSHNQLTDLGFHELCESLEKCACLRHLDVSYNKFGGLQSVSFGKLIQYHKGLLTINCAGNMLLEEVTTSIVLGIRSNETLRRLDLSWCNIQQSAADKLADALLDNDLLELNLDHNPVNREVREDAREYAARRRPPSRPGSSGATRGEYIRSKEIAAESIGEAWRNQIIKDVEQARAAYTVVMDMRQRVDGLPISQVDEDGAELQFHIRPSDAAENARRRNLASNAAMMDVIDGRNILSVAYGRRTEVIGSIEVTDTMTFCEARELVVPLLETYFHSATPETVSHALNYRMYDALGHILTPEAEKVRMVWNELSSCGYCLHIHPADWILIPKGEDDSDSEPNNNNNN